jgi:hypothetical protein
VRTPPARAPFHRLRSAMIAATMVALAAFAHLVAGGQLPAPGILLAVVALTGLASTAATRLKLSLPAMTGLLATGQLVLHEAFTAFGGTLPGPAGTAAPHHQVPVLLPVGRQGHFQPHELDSSFAVLMFAGHMLATLACALLLAKGEDALWSLAAWLRPLIQLPAPVASDVVAAPAASGWPADSAPLPWRNLRLDCRRGPPAAVVIS